MSEMPNADDLIAEAEASCRVHGRVDQTLLAAYLKGVIRSLCSETPLQAYAANEAAKAADAREAA